MNLPMLSMPKDKIPILLLEGVATSAVEAFTREGYTNVRHLPNSPPAPELEELLQETMILGIRSRTAITASILEMAPKLFALGCYCIGTNQVDLAAAQGRGIAVFHAPYSNTRSVAELVMGEAIMLLRGIPEKNAAAHLGVWKKSAKHSFELRGKVLGIIGYGHIGTQVGILAESLGMEVHYFDIASKLSLGNAKPTGSLEELLALSDVITLHVPASPTTQNLLNGQNLPSIKKGAFLINASRGNVVEIDAVKDLLDTGHLLGAALDVFPQEPKTSGERFTSPLQHYPNVLLTPHIGGSTEEAQRDIGLEVSHKLINYSDNGTTTSAVNFPEMALTANPGKHRVINIHQNIPGMMSKINQAIANNGANISAQYLQTRDKIGYVTIDVDQDVGQRMYQEIKELEGSIRTRILYL